MSAVDPGAVPQLENSVVCCFTSKAAPPVYAYAMRLEKLCALSDNPMPTGDWRAVYDWYATPLHFTARLLYLVALMHMAGIVHGTACHLGPLLFPLISLGDLKPDNLALDRSANLRILDFSGSVRDNRTHLSADVPVVERRRIRAITKLYAAPELSGSGLLPSDFAHADTVTGAIDVYSVGAILRDLRRCLSMNTRWSVNDGVLFIVPSISITF